MNFKLPPNEIQGESGEIYRLKKPLYRQALFWTSLVSSILGLFFFLVSLGLMLINIDLEEENTYLKQYSDYYSSREDQEAGAYTDYPMGDRVVVDESLAIKVENIRMDKERQMNDESAGTPIVVTIKVENTGGRPFLLSPYAFDLYDQSGELYILDSSTFEHAQVGRKIPAGQSAELELVFDGEDSTNKTYSVTYEQIRWGSKNLSI